MSIKKSCIHDTDLMWILHESHEKLMTVILHDYVFGFTPLPPAMHVWWHFAQRFIYCWCFILRNIISLKLIIHVIHQNYIPAHLTASKPFQTDCSQFSLSESLVVLGWLKEMRVWQSQSVAFSSFRINKMASRPWRELWGFLIASCWNLQPFISGCHGENPQNCDHTYCRVFGILRIGPQSPAVLGFCGQRLQGAASARRLTSRSLSAAHVLEKPPEQNFNVVKLDVKNMNSSRWVLFQKI